MRLKYLSVLLLFLSITTSLPAQKKIVIDRVYSTKPIDVAMPVMVDSANLKGNKFQNKDLLETYISVPTQDKFTEALSADVMREYFFFPKAQEGARFRLLSFQVTADRYSKAKIKVTSPGMFEVYINDKKELSKTTVEDSLSLAKVFEKEYTSTPGATSFLIKYMGLSTNVAPDGVKISLETIKGDSLTNLKIVTNGKRPINIEDILRGTRITNTQTSPDGRYVLISYKLVASDGKQETYTELFEPRTNRRTNLGSKDVKWMPMSNKFYYTAKSGDDLQLITVDPLIFSENIFAQNIPSGNFYFSPDEKYLFYTDREQNDDRKGDLKLLASPEDRQPGYFDRYFIYKYDLSNGVKQRLTFGKHSTIINDFSPDSRYLLFSTTEETITQSPYRKSSMYRLDIQTLGIETLWTDEPFAYSATFSPDGSKILISGGPEAFNGVALDISSGVIPNSYDIQAFVMDLATKKTEAISKNFLPSISNTWWNKSDNMIYFRVVDKDYESVYSYDPHSKKYSKLDLPENVINNFSLAANAPFASFFGQSVSNSTRAYTLDLKSGRCDLASDPLRSVMQSITLGEVKDWNFTSSDGTTIDGRYYLPPNFDSSKKYPMIVYYYGGTLPTARTLDHPYPMHVYAAQGYVVYVIQPSGTIGFGQEFSTRHVNAWGKRSAEDIIEGTKQFINTHSFIDQNKMGCIGASYGGFMTMYLQTQTDIFAAAVSHAGISALSSYWGEGYWGYTYSSAASANSYPWNNKELYTEQSPLFNADKIKTPLLLLHGTEDTNVPIGESIQMYTALKILGRPVEFIQVKGENHGITNYKRRIEWNNSIYAWFAKWLKNDPAWWESMYPELK